MEKLYEKLDIVKEELNNIDCIKNLKVLTNDLSKDKELLTLIEKYNYSKDERIKEEILKNTKYRDFLHNEAELNFLILEINQILKQITKKDKCGL